MFTCLYDAVGYALFASMCYVFMSMPYDLILVFTCLYAWTHVLPCLCVRLLHVYMHVSMSTCLDLCFHMPMCLDLCSLHVLYYFSCVRALHAMFVRSRSTYSACLKWLNICVYYTSSFFFFSCRLLIIKIVNLFEVKFVAH